MLKILCKDCKKIVKTLTYEELEGEQVDFDDAGSRGSLESVYHEDCNPVDITLSDIETRELKKGTTVNLNVFSCGNVVNETKEEMSMKDSLYAQGEVYLVVGIEKPTIKEIEETGNLGRIVMEMTAVMASNESDAISKALISCKNLEGINQDKLEIKARPF